MIFSDHLLKQIQSRISLADIVRKKVSLVRKGNQFLGLCPFHQEKTPSFTVNEQKGFYYCFGCQASGDIFSFVKETENLSFKEVVRRLARQACVTLPEETKALDVQFHQHKASYEAMAWFANFCHEILLSSLGEKAKEYLLSRHIVIEDIKKFQIGWCPGDLLIKTLLREKKDMRPFKQVGLIIETETKDYPRFKDRIIFPILDKKNRAIAFGGRSIDMRVQPKYLNSPEHPLFSKKQTLYMHQESKGTSCVLVEGYLDVIAVSRFLKAIAPLGTAMSKEQIELALQSSPHLYVCFDGDAAGRKAALQLAIKALQVLKPEHKISFVLLPQNEDPQSLIAKEGIASFKQYLEGSISLADFLWKNLRISLDERRPETKVLAIKQYEEWIHPIQNLGLRHSYVQFFKDRLYEFYRPFLKPLPLQKKRFQEKRPLDAPLLKPYRLEQKILLGIPVLFPYILLQVQENIAQIKIYDEEWQSLQNALLNFSEENPATLQSFLYEKTGIQWAEKFFDLERHIPCELFKDVQALYKYWLQLFGQCYAKQQRQDALSYYTHLSRDLTKEEWEDMQKLREELCKEI